MSVLKLIGFSGEQPRVLPRLMPEMAAQSAINARLDDGGLTPMRESVLIATLDDLEDPQTIYLQGDTWLGWDTVVHPVPGAVADDRLYFTGDGVPKMRVGADTFDLKVPFPAGALTATLGGSGSGDVVTRLYVYTFVTSFGEESEPSPASASIDWQPGMTVTLSGFAAAPSGRNITRQRIYRTQTGSSGTGLYLIDERDAADTDYVDSIAPDAFMEPLPSADWNAPPDGLSGLVSMPNGMMAAFVGRDIYFCEPYRHHAWPEKYVLSVNADVVGLGSCGASLIIMTKRTPYIAAGSAPEAMQMQEIEQNFPCINAGGIVDLGYAIAYPSQEGLVTVSADGTCNLATINIFNRDKWLQLRPENMSAAQIGGRYAAFYQAVGDNGEVLDGLLLIDLSGQSFLIRSDVRGSGAYYDSASTALFFVARDTLDVYRFDAPAARRLNQYWKSKQYVLAAPENFGVLRVDAPNAISEDEITNIEAENAEIATENEAMVSGGLTMGEINAALPAVYPVNGDAMQALHPIALQAVVTVIADGVEVARVTRLNVPVRLPSGNKYRTWEIAIFGTAQVEQVVMATTMDELKVAG